MAILTNFTTFTYFLRSICLGVAGGGVSTNSVGYQKVREWANKRKDDYDLAPKKYAVLQEALDVLSELDPPGRILQKRRCGEDEYWAELEGKDAIAKIKYYCFQRNHDIRGDSSDVSPIDSSEVSPAEDPSIFHPTFPERKDVSEVDVISEREETNKMSPVTERDEVTKILNSMVTIVDFVANDEALSTHVDEEWLIEEKQVHTLLDEAFKQANVTNDYARWSSLQEHSNMIKSSFIFDPTLDPTFQLWWNDFDSRTCRLPRECIKVMTFFCRQQRKASFYTQDVAVLAPPGKLGMVLEIDSTGNAPTTNMVGMLRVSSVMANQICPGDRIVAIDDEDVSQMSVQEILSIMTRKNDKDKVLVIKPSLASTIEFTKYQDVPPSFQSNVEILLFKYVKAHITANRMRYNEVRVLLQLPPRILCEVVGCTGYGSNFDKAWSSVVPKLASWWVTVIDSKRTQSFDVTTSMKAFLQLVPDETSSSATLAGICMTKIQEICDCVKAYITANQLQYDDVSDLLHLRPSSVVELVGSELRELHNEMGSNKFGRALFQAKKHVLYWFELNSVAVIDESDSLDIGTQHTLEAIVEGDVVKVKVKQDVSLEFTAIQHRSNSCDYANDDDHKIAQVIKNAASLPHCEKTQKGCLRAIEKYVASEKLKSLTLHNMLAHAIANALKSHPECSNIQAEALSTFSQIVWSLPAAAKQIVNEEGCLQLAVKAMEMHSSHSKTQQSACELFVALSYDKTCCRTMLDSDVISSVLMSIRGCLKKSQPKALASGLLFLQNMAVISLESVAKAILREENVLSTLLQTIQTKTSSINLLISLFGLLSNLVLHTDVRSQIENAGGVEMIQDKLASIKNAQLLSLALKTLLNMTLNTTVVRTLAENCCAYEIVAHANARASRGNPDLLLVSLGLLDKLIDAEDTTNQNEVESGAESIALAALADHSSNKQLRSIAISVLQKVSE